MADLWAPVSGVYWSSAPVLPNLEWIGNLGSSSLFTTVVGALAGAFFGAWAAQRIAERVKLREELQKELRSTNAGITLALTTANLALALKKQYVRDLKASYDSDCERLEAHRQAVAAGRSGGVFELAPNLLILQELTPPIPTLQEIVLGRLSTVGRAVTSVTALADAFGNLNYAIAKRNELMERMKEGKLPEGAKTHHYYFGIPYKEGQSNQEYGGYIEAMAKYTDDAIFFGLKLCEDLEAHGILIAKKHKENYGGEAPGVTAVDLAQAQKDDLIPKDDGYLSWLSGFQLREKKALPRWWQWRRQAARRTATAQTK